MNQPDPAPSPDADEIVRLRRALAESEARLDALRMETRHRIRNLLAVVRAVAARGAEGAASLEELRMHQGGRISALVRVEAALDAAAGGGVGLEDLLREELRLIEGPVAASRVRLDGPPAWLLSRAAGRLGLAFHELATNALKFGALATPDGRLDIAWGLDDEGLDLTWTESGGPANAGEQARAGFGRDLIENALPYDLRARTTWNLAPGGLRCRLRIPARDNLRAGDAGASTPR